LERKTPAATRLAWFYPAKAGRCAPFQPGLRFFVNKSRLSRPADFPKNPFSSNKAQNSINCSKIANVSGAYR